MSRQRASSPPPERREEIPVTPNDYRIPVTPNDYRELLRHLNTQGHIVVLNLYVPNRPKKTWGQFFKRTNVPEDVLYKEDIKGLMDELKAAIENGTMISDSSSEKLKSINTMLHEKKSQMYQPSATSATTSATSATSATTSDDEFGFGTYAQQQKQKDRAKKDAAHLAALIAWQEQHPNWRADAERNANDLKALDDEKLLEEYHEYQSRGGGPLGVLPLKSWLILRNREQLPNMTVPGEVGKPYSSKRFANLLGYFDWGRMDDDDNPNGMGGKSKRILKSKSRSNKGKKTHRSTRSRSTCRRSTCRRSTRSRSTCRRSTCRR
jgi:hypothetical protein